MQTKTISYSAQILIFIFLSSVLYPACKKETEKEYCWQMIDMFGNENEKICGKTEAQMKATYPNDCSYYKIEGPSFCWMVNGTAFIENKTESGIEHYKRCFNGTTAVKVSCDYCKRFYSRIKRTYKPANTSTFSSITVARYCGDTATTLYHGRQVIMKDTPDSLVVLQFSSTGIF